MFYRIIDNKIRDYADYEYAQGCLFTDLCTMSEFDKNPDFYIIDDGQIKLNPDLDNILAKKREDQFKKEFFNTCLGWIRRSVSMKNGTKKDFLGDLLLPIKVGLDMGQAVEIITYQTPDFTKELTKDYLISLQKIEFATNQFIQECLTQTVKDFGLKEGGQNGV